MTILVTESSHWSVSGVNISQKRQRNFKKVDLSHICSFMAQPHILYWMLYFYQFATKHCFSFCKMWNCIGIPVEFYSSHARDDFATSFGKWVGRKLYPGSHCRIVKITPCQTWDTLAPLDAHKFTLLFEMIYYKLGAICNLVLHNNIINVWTENVDEINSCEVINWTPKQG